MFWSAFLLQIFCQSCFKKVDFIKIVRLVVAAVSINGFNQFNLHKIFLMHIETSLMKRSILHFHLAAQGSKLGGAGSQGLS